MNLRLNLPSLFRASSVRPLPHSPFRTKLYFKIDAEVSDSSLLLRPLGERASQLDTSGWHRPKMLCIPKLQQAIQLSDCCGRVRSSHRQWCSVAMAALFICDIPRNQFQDSLRANAVLLTSLDLSLPFSFVNHLVAS